MSARSPSTPTLPNIFIPSRRDQQTTLPSPSLKDNVGNARRQQFSEWLLDHKGSDFPSLQALREFKPEPETAASVASEIKERKEQQQRLMAEWLSNQARERHRLVYDGYLARVQGAPQYTGNNPEADAEREMIDRWRDPAVYEQQWKENDRLLRETNQRTLRDLEEKQKKLAEQEKLAIARMFPSNIAALWRMTDPRARTRAMRFLVADEMRQEQFMKEFGWSRETVKPLKEAYDSNMEFQQGVQDKLKATRAHGLWYSVGRTCLNKELKELSLLDTKNPTTTTPLAIEFRDHFFAQVDLIGQPTATGSTADTVGNLAMHPLLQSLEGRTCLNCRSTDAIKWGELQIHTIAS